MAKFDSQPTLNPLTNVTKFETRDSYVAQSPYTRNKCNKKPSYH